MKVIFDLKHLHVTSMDNAVINVGKNWIVTHKKQQTESEKRGESDRVEHLGDDPATGPESASTGT